MDTTDSSADKQNYIIMSISTDGSTPVFDGTV